jgi:hypothetical protein
MSIMQENVEAISCTTLLDISMSNKILCCNSFRKIKYYVV